MDLFDTLIRGLLIGFSIAAPLGPIGVSCIKRTLAEGRASGFSCGLGAASADAVYGGVAAFGLISISSFLVDYQPRLACTSENVYTIVTKKHEVTGGYTMP
jgi:threonine/homoserine/homoserine lactone efflux protein